MAGLLYYIIEVKSMSNDIFNLNTNFDAIQNNAEMIRKTTKAMENVGKLDRDSKKANIEALEVLKRIEMNTAYLKDVVDLLNTNNDHQQELNEMVQDILNIAKAPDKKEAQTRYRSVMKKMGDFGTVTTSTLNILKLSSLASTVLQFFMQSH